MFAFKRLYIHVCTSVSRFNTIPSNQFILNWIDFIKTSDVNMEVCAESGSTRKVSTQPIMNCLTILK
jgi:hypothetical protein